MKGRIVRIVDRIKSHLQKRNVIVARGVPVRLPLLPQLLDTYILDQFLFFFALLLGSFVAMTEVFNFFDLLGDIVKNKIPLAKVFVYLFFLTPKLIYDTASDQRAGRGPGNVRSTHQAERSDRLQGLRG